MSDPILQSFLDNRFIKTDASEHIEYLQKASDAVQKLLKQKKNYPKIISYTLVALDPTISGDDPIIEEVDALIIKQWATFRNSVAKTKDTPISYIQAVILDALDKLSKDENFAAIIWHAGCNIIGYYKLAGQEEVLTNFLREIGKKVEEVGRKNWKVLESVNVDSLDSIQFTFPEIRKGKVDKGIVQEHLIAAAVHSAWVSQAGGGENPSQPAAQNHQWPKFFAERAASGLSTEINSALSSQNEILTSIAKSFQESINTYFANLNPHLEQISSSILQSSLSLIQRTDLLWWRQALYSSRLDSSYRALHPLAMVLAMAVDLADSVSPIYPRSVDHFLRETLRDVLGDGTDTKVPVTEILEQLQRLPESEKRLLEDVEDVYEGRKPLGVCIADLVKGKINVDQFFSHTGLEKKAQIAFGELIIWLFHDLQAYKLANTK